MALQDILQAITDEADARIAAAQKDHKARVKDMKAAHESTLQQALARAKQQKDARLHDMRSRAQGRATMHARHMILRRKKQLLDECYDSVADALAALPKDEVEAFLATCIAQIPEVGVLHPAKPHEAIVKKLAGKHTVGESIDVRGGFRFVGKLQDCDYTFEFLVHHLLRPETEIAAAKTLFPDVK